MVFAVEPVKKENNLQEDIDALKPGFDLIDDHVVITDIDGNIVYANYAVQRNTGFNPGEIVGKNPGILWGGNMPKDFYEKMWHRIKTEKKPFIGEVKNKKKDGAEYWQELRIYPVFDQRGDIKLFIGIEPNITARKSAEDETKKKYDEIDKFNKMMMSKENMQIVELQKRLEDLKSRLT